MCVFCNSIYACAITDCVPALPRAVLTRQRIKRLPEIWEDPLKVCINTKYNNTPKDPLPYWS